MMESFTKQKTKGNSVSRIKQLFEIKRPPKSSASIVPRTKSNASEDETDVGKERMFIRNNRSRNSSRKNKYRKELPKEVTEDVENKVPQLCRQFSMTSVGSATSRDTPFPNPDLFLSRSRSDEHIDKILTNSKVAIEELKQLYENVEVKRRNNQEKKDKEVRNKKIRSFADAMNEGETEEYRRNVVREIDQHIAHMKDDGFLDELGNIVLPEVEKDEDCDIFSPKENVFLSVMRHNSSSDDSSDTSKKSDDRDGHTSLNKPTDHRVLPDGFEYQLDTNADAEGVFITVTKSNDSSELNDEFTESLSEDLENGLNIVETYNDDGRELIEVQVLIDRRVVNLETFTSMKEELAEGIKQSDMVFYRNTDERYEVIGECENGDIVEKEDEPVLEYVEANVEQMMNCGAFTCMKEEVVEAMQQPDTVSHRNGGEIFKEIEECANGDKPRLVNKEADSDGKTLEPDERAFAYIPDSGRSTMYSTTSRDSSDEGNSENEYVNVRRETFCDNNGIVRIERSAHPEKPVEICSLSESADVLLERSDSPSSARRLEYIADEIKSTERKYVDDLTKVVTVFKPYIEDHTPEHLKSTQGYLFGNIEKILRRQKKFLAALEECEGHINRIVNCFLDHEKLFEMYPIYFRNKPKADTVLRDFVQIIMEMQEHFEERLNFSAYLLTPVQRLGKYILFLENIEKELKKLDMPIGSTQMALDIVKSEMSKGNDYVAIDSIQNSPISKLDYGSFKMQEHFSINKPRRVDSMVFLFSNVVVLTTMEPGNHEVFNYYDSIKMEDLRIATFENFTIHLTDYTKSKRKSNSFRYTYVLEAKTEKIWNTWREAIENILWQQLYRVKEMTLTRIPSKYKFNKYKNLSKSTGTSTKDHRYFT